MSSALEKAERTSQMVESIDNSLKVFITARPHLFSIVIVFLPGTNFVFCDCSYNFKHVTVNTCVLPVAKLLCMTWLLTKTRFCVWTGQKQG